MYHNGNEIDDDNGGILMPRNMVGYGGEPYNPKWPDGKKVALSLVLNYEEGAENCLLNGDTASESLLSEMVGVPAYPLQRHTNMESIYDFGSRAGFWRLHRLLNRTVGRNVTVYACGMALEKNKEAALAMKSSGWEIASHGYRWIDYQNVNEVTEMNHIERTVQIHQDILGNRPIGIYQGKPNQFTRQRIYQVEKQNDNVNFLYSNDSYADDLPYWISDEEKELAGKPHLIIPYSLSENDMRFVSANNYSNGREFSAYLIDHLAYLLQEARTGETHGSMMSVGLHCRLAGRAGRAKGLQDFLDYAISQEDVWICRRDEIASHWYKEHWNNEWGKAPEVPIL